MSALVLFIIALAVPLLILFVFRVDASLIYLTLCLGYVLVQFIVSDAISLLTAFYPNANQIGESTLKLFLLLLPAVLTIIFMFHSVSGTKRVVNILPSIAVGLLLILLIQPQLPQNISQTLVSSSLWNEYQKFQTLIVGGGSLLCLFMVWTNRKPKHAHGKSKH